MTKRCNICLKIKDINEFSTGKNDRGYDYINARCKLCASKKHNEANVARARRKKAEIVKLLGGKCKECGYKKCLRALDLDHINSKEKEYHIKSVLYGGVKMKVFLKNIKKFQLLCANCHREKHCADMSHHML